MLDSFRRAYADRMVWLRGFNSECIDIFGRIA